MSPHNFAGFFGFLTVITPAHSVVCYSLCSLNDIVTNGYLSVNKFMLFSHK